MDAITNYFSAHPSLFTILIVLIGIALLYFVLKQLIKLALVFLFIILLVSGIYFFKDPASMPDKIQHCVALMKNGTEEISEKARNFFSDTKELFGKAKKVPGDINRLLDDSNEKPGKK